jgi:hypothetical protein
MIVVLCVKPARPGEIERGDAEKSEGAEKT